MLRAFQHSDDYSWVKLDGQEYTLPELAALVIRRLDEARLRGSPVLPWGQIASQLPGPPAKMSSVFRTVPNSERLVIREGRNKYRLNVP
jgi:hypothetical protein